MKKYKVTKQAVGIMIFSAFLLLSGCAGKKNLTGEEQPLSETKEAAEFFEVTGKNLEKTATSPDKKPGQVDKSAVLYSENVIREEKPIEEQSENIDLEALFQTNETTIDRDPDRKKAQP